MYYTLFQWLMSLINTFANFGTWLTTPFINGWTPLTLFSVGGLTFLIGLLVLHLFNFINV